MNAMNESEQNDSTYKSNLSDRYFDMIDNKSESFGPHEINIFRRWREQ